MYRLTIIVPLGEKQGSLTKKKRQSDSDVLRERWFVVKNGILSYYRDRKV